MYPAACTYASGRSLFDWLIGRCRVSVNLEIPNGIAVLAALVAGIAFYGVDTAAVGADNDAHMVGAAVHSIFGLRPHLWNC